MAERGKGKRGKGRGGDRSRPSAPPIPPPDRESVRLFVAAELPGRSLDELSDLAESMRPSAKASSLEVAWVPPENYHLTLKYLGWCRLAVLELLKDELSKLLAKDSSFEIRMRGVGAFPEEKKARVFWVGLERGERELAALAKKIDQAVAEFGFEPEKRAYIPHVTLGRFRKVGDATNLVLPFSDQSVRGGRVERITLYESFEGPKGTHYHRHAHWPLAW